VLSSEPFFVAQKCTKSFSDWGFAPDSTGELITLPRPPKGEGENRRGGQGKGGKRKEGNRREIASSYI